MTRWAVHGTRSLYSSDWLDLQLVEVEPPGLEPFEHHVIRTRPAAGTVITDARRGVLLLWRHRFITDTWGWEIPAGRVEDDESPEEAASREALEESGWSPGPLVKLGSYRPHNGLADTEFHLFLATSATEIGPPTDNTEAERVEWVSVAEVQEAIERGQVQDGMSLTGLLWALASGRL